MVKKVKKMSDDKKSDSPLPGTVKDSAQKIWLAGLGAFSKAQEGSGKMFESLMKEGVSIQRKTQAVAEDKLAEATSKMANLAGDIQSKAGNQWDKLENIFEDRVAKALNKLGAPSAEDVDALKARIDELTKTIEKMSSKAQAGTAAKPRAKSVVKPAAKKETTPAAKRSPIRKSA